MTVFTKALDANRCDYKCLFLSAKRNLACFSLEPSKEIPASCLGVRKRWTCAVADGVLFIRSGSCAFMAQTLKKADSVDMSSCGHVEIDRNVHHELAPIVGQRDD